LIVAPDPVQRVACVSNSERAADFFRPDAFLLPPNFPIVINKRRTSTVVNNYAVPEYLGPFWLSAVKFPFSLVFMETCQFVITVVMCISGDYPHIFVLGVGGDTRGSRPVRDVAPDRLFYLVAVFACLSTYCNNYPHKY
jgi:hypothetical protein